MGVGHAEHRGVDMPVGSIETEIRAGYFRLARSAAAVTGGHRRWVDGLAGQAGELFSQVAGLTLAHPWALGRFCDQAWDGYQPDPDTPPPEGLRVGVLRPGAGLPPVPAVAPFARHGHLLIDEGGDAGRARSLLQAVTLRLATATGPGTVRLALADPVGQGRYLSAFLRLPAPLRVVGGGAAAGVGAGVASSPAEIEALLAALTRHVVEVTQTRLTNVYDSVEAYNAGTTGATVPYHVLVLAGFPAGIGERAGELLAGLALHGPRAGLY